MDFKYLLFRWMLDGLDLIFPPLCGGCNRPGYKFCPDCQHQLQVIRDPICRVCGNPLQKGDQCSDCLENPPPFKSMRSWVKYDGPIRNALLKLKYIKNFSLGDELARQVAGVIPTYGWRIDCIVPIPLGKKRFVERGYNQVAMIAFSLAEMTHREYLPRALERIRETQSQVGLTADQRRENVRNAFSHGKGNLEGKSILLLDDIATTGATIREGTQALLAGGAREVYVFTISRAVGLKQSNISNKKKMEAHMTVNVEISVKSMELTDQVKEYVNKKASKLDRYLHGIDLVKVDLANMKSARDANDRNVAQITVRGPRILLRTEERADDLFSAFDSAWDKMQRQAERFKGKRARGRGDGRTAAEVLPLPQEKQDEEISIARRKTFDLIPMNESEALEQMKLLGHEKFFIFFNVESNSINVLYQRRDGSYGLIEPKIH